MYAVIQTGGKQYKVAEGETIQVEKIEGEPGQTVLMNQVLLVVDGQEVKVGQPLVIGANVTAQIQDQGRQRKVFIFKYKRRKRYRRRAGHRQPFTALKITGIQA